MHTALDVLVHGDTCLKPWAHAVQGEQTVSAVAVHLEVKYVDPFTHEEHPAQTALVELVQGVLE